MPPTQESAHRYLGRLAELLRGKKARKSVAGSKLIATRLRKLGALAPNKQPIEFVRVLFFNKGDVVPSGFRDIPGLKVDRRGRVLAAYTDAWQQSHWNDSGDWGNTWSERWDNSTSLTAKTGLVVNLPFAGVKAFQLSEFSPKELAALAKFKV